MPAHRICIVHPTSPPAIFAGLADLPVVSAADAHDFDFAVCRHAGRLQITVQRTGAPGPVFVDFVHGPGARRWRDATRRQPLARAAGITRAGIEVFDATAGLGRDASVLAALGCRVTAVERHPVLFALLEDGLLRAAAADDQRLRAWVERITAVCADARALLADARPEVVYLDPMFPARTKRALVKKEMQLFQALLGTDADTADLLTAARAAATRRVVVKRPAHAPPLAPRPDHTVHGTRVRFDVYLA